MKDYIEERAVEIAYYIIETKATVRQTAKKFGISKSTVHKDVTDRLSEINPGLAGEARKILDVNKEERHIRGRTCYPGEVPSYAALNWRKCHRHLLDMQYKRSSCHSCFSTFKSFVLSSGIMMQKRTNSPSRHWKEEQSRIIMPFLMQASKTSAEVRPSRRIFNKMKLA